MANTTTTTLHAVPTYRSELDRLATLMPALAQVFDSVETADPDKPDALNEACAGVRRAFLPHLTDDDETGPYLGAAAREAADIAIRLSVSQHLRESVERPHPAADLLIRLSRENRIEPGPDLDDFIRNLPWLIKTALEQLLSTGCAQERPTSPEAITARMLAAILECLEKVEGFRHEAPEGQH